MNINPLIQIEERIQEVKKQKELFYHGISNRVRKNNRKTTRCRKSQHIRVMVKGSFPPVFYSKFIKTN